MIVCRFLLLFILGFTCLYTGEVNSIYLGISCFIMAGTYLGDIYKLFAMNQQKKKSYNLPVARLCLFIVLLEVILALLLWILQQNGIIVDIRITAILIVVMAVLACLFV